MKAILHIPYACMLALDPEAIRGLDLSGAFVVNRVNYGPTYRFADPNETFELKFVNIGSILPREAKVEE